jgi:hypothetical protein
MPLRTYARRRVNPYRGVVHVLDLGEAMAHTYDGLTWHLRAEDGQGLMRPVGVWVEGEGVRAGTRIPPELIEALRQHPPLPFMLADRMELWLLDKAQGLPLALLATELPSRYRYERIEPEWHPFPLSYIAFRSAALARREDSPGTLDSRHRDWLARTVNGAARPYPAAQWFQRRPDGAGEGRAGLRLEVPWQRRRLSAQDFPELLVRASWNNPLEQSVIKDYHTWLAPLLLLLPDLSDATRAWLEVAACRQPAWLARVHRLLPRVLDPARINAALVAARLQAAAGTPETAIFDY